LGREGRDLCLENVLVDQLRVHVKGSNNFHGETWAEGKPKPMSESPGGRFKLRGGSQIEEKKRDVPLNSH